jgi:threonyl-tRNA synthetase
MIHRVVLAGIERFYGVLVEHYGGEFPVWLAPVQAVIIPVADRHLDYAREVEQALLQEGLRVEVDDDRQTVNMKIRRAQMQKVPFSLIVGDKEIEGGTVSVRDRKGSDIRGVPLQEFMAKTVKLAEERSLESDWEE